MTAAARAAWSGVFTLLLLAPLFLTSQDFIGSGTDLLLQHGPLREAGYEALREGVWPLWNPYIASGLPYQTGFRTLAYPIHVLGLFLPLGATIKASIAVHFFLGAFFMMSAMNELGFGRYPSLVAGATFSGSGFFMGRLYAGHMDWVEPIAYTPLVLWAFLRAYQNAGAGWTVGCAAVVGAMALSGNYHPVYLTLVGVIGLWLVLALAGSRYACSKLDWGRPWLRERVDRRVEAESWELCELSVAWKDRLGDLGNAAFRLALVAGLSIGMTAFRLLPSAEAALFSNRLSAPESFRGGDPPMWSELVYLIPHFFEGTTAILCWSEWPSWERQSYLGVVLLCLCAFAFLGRKEAWLPPAVPALFALLVSFGDHTFLYRVWRAVDPLLQNFRAPGRFTLIVLLFACWLAALGLEQALQDRPARRRRVLAALPVFVLCLGLFLWLWSLRGDLAGWARFVAACTSPEAWSYLQQPHADGLVPLLHTSIGRALLALVLAGLALLAAALPGRWAGRLFLTLVVVDLAAFAYPYLKTAPAEVFQAPPGVAARLRDLPPGSRVQWAPELQWYNRLAPLKVSDVAAYEYFLDGPYVEAMNLQLGYPRERLATLVQGRAGAFWDLQGAALYIAPAPVEREGFELWARTDGLLLYANRKAFPRAFVVAEWPAASVEELMRLLSDGEALRQAIVAVPSEFELDWNRVEMVVELQQKGVLVLTDAPWPGWRVSVDGEPAEMLSLSGGLHRGVRLEPGRREVSFTYWPGSLTLGFALSFLTLLAALALSRPWSRNRLGAETPPDSDRA